MWQHLQRVVGYLITTLLQIYPGILSSREKKFVNRFRFDKIMAMSLWPRFLVHPVRIVLNVGLLFFATLCRQWQIGNIPVGLAVIVAFVA